MPPWFALRGADSPVMATDLITAIDGVVAVRNELTASTQH